MVTPLPPPTHSIEINSYAVVSATKISPAAMHHELVFKEGQRVISAFNGDSYDRSTGKINYISASNQDTLRVSTSGQTRAQSAKIPKPLIATTTVYAGSAAEVLEKLGIATTASHYINKQNIDYIAVSPMTDAQNSNSVTGTLMRAMGLRMPQALESLWSPGLRRNLLPDDFKTGYDNITRRHPNWLATTPDVFKTLDAGLNSLHVPAVAAQVRKDPNPHMSDCKLPMEVDCKVLGRAKSLLMPATYSPSQPTAPAPAPAAKPKP